MKTLTIEVKVPVAIEFELEDGEIRVGEIGPGRTYREIYDEMISYLSENEATLKALIAEALEEWK